jgi:predicted metalloprotease
VRQHHPSHEEPDGTMKFNRRARLDTSQIRDRRGAGGAGRRGSGLGGLGRGGGGIGMGRGVGGIGGLLILLVVLFAGGGNLLSSGGDGGDAPAGGELEACEDLSTNRECRFVAIENSLQDHWEAQLGEGYALATFNVFTGGVNTGCGQASSAVGPFYCPADQGVYLDLGFFDELESRFGAEGGEFAEAYIIAHEFGHHVQNLTGQMAQVRTREGPESDAVRLELQADCYAGVWGQNATEGADPLITEISADDIASAVDAAERVGDDYIQETFGNGVNPESWTHGSSEQRRRWFEIGYASGDPRTCDTFGAATL